MQNINGITNKWSFLRQYLSDSNKWLPDLKKVEQTKPAFLLDTRTPVKVNTIFNLGKPLLPLNIQTRLRQILYRHFAFFIS